MNPAKHPDLTERPCRFWMVWNKHGGAPTRAHDKKGAAEHEAKRLAAKNPGLTFVVLAAYTKFKVDAVEPAPEA